MPKKGKTRLKTSMNIIGDPIGVLSDDWIAKLLTCEIEDTNNCRNIFPFAGKLKLPTKDQVLRLFVYCRESEKFPIKVKNSNVRYNYYVLNFK